MVIEEPSVIAGASKAAKIARLKGGFVASADTINDDRSGANSRIAGT